MRRKKSKPAAAVRIVVATASVFLLASCMGHRRESTLADVKKMPYKAAAAYSADIGATLAAPVPERIGAVPAVLLDYLRKADGNPAYANYSPTDPERTLFAQYYATLPPRFKKAMESKLLGIYFIEGLAGGGLSDFVFQADGTMFLILTLNPKILRLSLADWIAYRDSSPYEDDGKGVELRSICSGNYKGLIHTLTHEAAHLYDYAGQATPYAETDLAAAAATAATKDFTRGVWTDYSTPVPSYAIPRRSEIASYGLGKKLPLSLAAEQYAALAKTPFASLYGSGSWAEDFAEAAAWKHLENKLGIKYSVVVLRGGHEELRFLPGKIQAFAARNAALRSALE